jgi:hypothetical protein
VAKRKRSQDLPTSQELSSGIVKSIRAFGQLCRHSLLHRLIQQPSLDLGTVLIDTARELAAYMGLTLERMSTGPSKKIRETSPRDEEKKKREIYSRKLRQTTCTVTQRSARERVRSECKGGGKERDKEREDLGQKREVELRSDFP